MGRCKTLITNILVYTAIVGLIGTCLDTFWTDMKVRQAAHALTDLVAKVSAKVKP